METILITGGSGMIGKSLTAHLIGEDYRVIILSRKPIRSINKEARVSYATWDIQQGKIDLQAIQKADHVIHLAGAGVMDKKWTEAYKQEIMNSRVKSSQLLVNTLKNIENKVKTVICASATGWYGDDIVGNIGFIETSIADSGFLGQTCKLWEENIGLVSTLNKKLVIFRMGVVLSNYGGVLEALKHPLRFGIAGIFGNGKQIISWIHIDDLCRLFTEAIKNNNISGVYNAVAPSPVSNQQLTIELAKHLKGHFFIPIHIPGFVLKILLGNRSIELLKSVTVDSGKIKDTGFSFLYPTIKTALRQLCKS